LDDALEVVEGVQRIIARTAEPVVDAVELRYVFGQSPSERAVPGLIASTADE
jgi:hypothetical protein